MLGLRNFHEFDALLVYLAQRNGDRQISDRAGRVLHLNGLITHLDGVVDLYVLDKFLLLCERGGRPQRRARTARFIDLLQVALPIFLTGCGPIVGEQRRRRISNRMIIEPRDETMSRECGIVVVPEIKAAEFRANEQRVEQKVGANDELRPEEKWPLSDNGCHKYGGEQKSAPLQRI